MNYLDGAAFQSNFTNRDGHMKWKSAPLTQPLLELITNVKKNGSHAVQNLVRGRSLIHATKLKEIEGEGQKPQAQRKVQ